MERIFITITVLYALFVGIYLLYLKAGKRRKKDIVGKGSAIRETGQLKADIIGKGTFKIKLSEPLEAKPEPIEATSPEIENPVENTDTFVPSDEEKPQTRAVAVPDLDGGRPAAQRDV